MNDGFYIGASVSEGDRPQDPDEAVPHPLLRIGDESGEVVEWLTLTGRDLCLLIRQLEDGRRYLRMAEELL